MRKRQNSTPVAVIVASWSGSNSDSVARLVSGMHDHTAGIDFNLYCCINGEGFTLPDSLSARFTRVFRRENLGFNLGAWDYCWRNLPGHDYFLFLQDECFIRRRNWLKGFLSAYRRLPGAGLVGENYNTRWSKPWDTLTDEAYSRRIAKRARCYRFWLEQRNIPIGSHAGHLATVAQFTSREVLEQVGGFDICESYDEAIAAEIAFSRKCINAGMGIAQADVRRHFFIGHPQWPCDRLLPAIRRHLTQVKPVINTP